MLHSNKPKTFWHFYDVEKWKSPPELKLAAEWLNKMCLT